MKAEPKLTRQQHRVLVAFRTYYDAKQIAPSYDDLAAALGVVKQTARDSCRRLLANGFLRKTDSRYRCYLLTRSGELLSRTAFVETPDKERAA